MLCRAIGALAASRTDRDGRPGRARKVDRNLSGAWRQRLALACAIVHNPPMLFLDEATAGVDPVSRREFWDLIYRMAGEGVSVLATTHYMDEAEYCNTIGMMYRGEMIALASPDTLRDEMPGALFQLDCDRPLHAKQILDALPGVIDASVHGARLHVSLESPDLQATLEQTLAGEGIHLTQLETIQPSLEDVFIHMVDKSRAALSEAADAD
jgi:ABC-2 type transport system ATP-binding protein